MIVMFDTNVLLDAIATRKEAAAAQELMLAVAEEKIQGLVSANSITDIYYIARKYIGAANAREAIKNLLKLFDVATVDGTACTEALLLPMDDFEDAVLAVCADRYGADYIATRDAGLIAEEEKCPVKADTPINILKALGEQ